MANMTEILLSIMQLNRAASHTAILDLPRSRLHEVAKKGAQRASEVQYNNRHPG